VCAFAQTPNYTSGGTPGPGRYGLWLIPLAVPVLAAASRAAPSWNRRLAPVAVASCLWAMWAYHPSRPESFLTPTRLAAYLWEFHPSLDDPLPDVFVERITHWPLHGPFPPVATPSCSKVLIAGGVWPESCTKPRGVPPRCATAEALCYANRRPAGGYRFASLR
jgi:hypothetical protein